MQPKNEGGFPPRVILPLRVVLVPLSWAYRLIIDIRNRAFDLGVLRTTAARVPVISIGNITVGGTGKTPLVEYLVSYCLRKGRKPAVISRGYRRATSGIVVVSDGNRVLVTASEGGDEPVQIARRYAGAAVVVGERRVDAAALACSQLGADVLILDDGFQHRYLRRDLDIVVLDEHAFGKHGVLIPAGILREPVSSIRRADVVAVPAEPHGLQTAGHPEQKVGQWCEGPVISFGFRMSGIHRVSDGASVTKDEATSKPVLAFCGIGNPLKFFLDLQANGFPVRHTVSFRDHHRYNLADIEEILKAMRDSGAEVCITTEKDAVRLAADEAIVHRFVGSAPVYYVRIEAKIVRGEDELLSRIDILLQKDAR